MFKKKERKSAEYIRKSAIRHLTHCVWMLFTALALAIFCCLYTGQHYEYIVVITLMLTASVILRRREQLMTLEPDRHSAADGQSGP